MFDLLAILRNNISFYLTQSTIFLKLYKQLQESADEQPERSGTHASDEGNE